MDVKILDEGQTGIKEVDGSVPMEEKIYAVRTLPINVLRDFSKYMLTTGHVGYKNNHHNITDSWVSN